MSDRSRHMSLMAFMQAQNSANYAGSWRNPQSMTDFLSPEYYQRIARTLESACFDMAFFDDRLAMPEIYGGSGDLAVEYGIQCVKLDPTVPMMAMAMATTHLGLGATYSTTYHSPYHVARLFASLDQLSGGRVAWNIVTSLNDAEAANFGRTEHLEHDSRYDLADEFVGAVTSLWRSWEPGAIEFDKKSGKFADPAKVHRTEFDGKFLSVNGTFQVPRTPQGHPVLIQAGQSGRGIEFAGNWGEVVFAGYRNQEVGEEKYRAVRQAVSDAGRDPDLVTIAPVVVTVVAETPELAAEKERLIRATTIPQDALVLLSETLNLDFSGRAADEPFSDEDLARMSNQTIREKVISISGKSNPTVEDFVSFSGRGALSGVGAVFTGTPEEVADEMESWFGSCADGFVVAAGIVPGAYEDFARLVVPELQRRGLARTEYAGTTLRENLGLPLPPAEAVRTPTAS